MAQKLTKNDKEMIADALMLKITSTRRLAKQHAGSKLVAEAYEKETVLYEALRGKILGQEEFEV